MRRRSLSALVALAAFALASVAPPAWAQDYPSKPVRIVVPHPPGGGADEMTRPIGQKLSESLKAPFVIDNRVGANGIIGTEHVVRSPADGYTLLFGSTSTLPMNVAIGAPMPFDPTRDLALIGTFASSPMVLVVHPSVPVNTLKEFLAFAKGSPDPLNYSSFSVGSVAHFGTALLTHATGVQFNHIPYKGAAAATLAVVSGEVPFAFLTLPAAMPHVAGGKLKALGLASPKRFATAPNIPTIAEAAGLADFEVSTVFAFLAPAGTPAAILQKLNAGVAAAVEQPDIAKHMQAIGFEPRLTSPAEAAAWLRAEIKKWSAVARAAKIRAE